MIPVSLRSWEVAVPRASVLTGYGPPEMLRWQEVRPLDPAAGQIRLRVRAAGVGPTDLAIRRGDLKAAFPLAADAVLGFEAAGIVDAVGDGLDGVAVGDEVAAWLPGLGGYGEHALASAWTIKPPGVSFVDAAALPASVEAAVGVLGQLGIVPGETLLLLGGAGAVGIIATQLAVSREATVIAAVNPRDHELLRELGATPVAYGARLVDQVREITPRVDAVMDAAGRDALPAAIELAGGTERVITLSDPRARELGVRLSAPTPDRAPRAVDDGMELLAAGGLRMKPRRELPLQDAAEAHRLLESGETHDKLVLVAPTH
jgi:NADPH:quinone reductase-like Zn-dependent oxidoreductase